MKKILLVLVLLSSANFLNAQLLYSFYAAGHAYGSPLNVHYGLHYPFVDYIPTINNYPGMELGFLTGGVVYSPDSISWDYAQADIDLFTFPVYIAAGNHDRGAEFVSRYGDYYHSFKHNGDLMIVLNPGGSWNIKNDQLDFLTETLDSNYQTVNNIFIFLHELIWWGPNNQY